MGMQVAHSHAMKQHCAYDEPSQCEVLVQGEDEVRQSGVPYAVLRPCALTEEPAGAELVISQGDTIKVTHLIAS